MGDTFALDFKDSSTALGMTGSLRSQRRKKKEKKKNGGGETKFRNI